MSAVEHAFDSDDIYTTVRLIPKNTGRSVHEGGTIDSGGGIYDNHSPVLG